VRVTRAAVLAFALACAPHAVRAQDAQLLPFSRADALLNDGRWAEAEAMYYAQSERSPRDPVARAALGRFIAMKGAIKPGIVLIQEAEQFGLSSSVARRLIAPLEKIVEWRQAGVELKRDSTVRVRPAEGDEALFQIPLPHFRANLTVTKEPARQVGISWYSVVPRGIGLDSVGAAGRPMGIEVIEALMPSLDVRANELTLHANPRSALSASGTRYQVLRTRDDVMVLVADRRALPLMTALRELRPTWWQLDLPHGILVVR
jgi:hypothetical protein